MRWKIAKPPLIGAVLLIAVALVIVGYFGINNDNEMREMGNQLQRIEQSIQQTNQKIEDLIKEIRLDREE